MTVEKKPRAGSRPGVASWCAVSALFCILPAGRAAAQHVMPADSVVASEVLTLERAVELALLRDPAAVAAASALSGAHASELVARGAWLPSLSLNSSYSNSSNQRFDQTTGQLVSQNYTSSIDGSIELFSGGRRLVNQRAAAAGVDAAHAGLVAQRFETILATTETFYAAAASADIVRAAEQRFERARNQLEFARTRLEVGTATISDVLRAELELGNAELAVLESRSTLRATALELGRRIGVEGGALPAESTLPAEAPRLPPLEELVARATLGSPSVVAAEATLSSRRAERLAAYTPYLPSLDLTGGYDWFAFDFPPNQQSWNLRLTASLPVFNGFQREAAVRRAAASERLAEARARDAVLAARVSVETAVQRIEVAERRVEISARSVDLAREDLRVQEERYRIGAATILDLQASQVALTESEIAAVRARQDLGSALARLEAILGERLGE